MDEEAPGCRPGPVGCTTVSYYKRISTKCNEMYLILAKPLLRTPAPRDAPVAPSICQEISITFLSFSFTPVCAPQFTLLAAAAAAAAAADAAAAAAAAHVVRVLQHQAPLHCLFVVEHPRVPRLRHAVVVVVRAALRPHVHAAGGRALALRVRLLRGEPRQRPTARGLHSSTFQLNVSHLCGTGGAFRGCLRGV